MALIPHQMAMGNRTEVPMYRMQRFTMPTPHDFFSGQPFRNLHEPPRELYRSDMEDSRFYPNVFRLTFEGLRIKIKASMCHYQPEDLKVELQDNYLVIEAKHEERQETRCFVTREFKRRVNMPPNIKPNEINGKWTPHRWLSIYIPLYEVSNPADLYTNKCGSGAIKRGSKQAKPKMVRSIPIRISQF